MTIKYEETGVGDILEITGSGAPGYASNGSLVRVVDVKVNSVTVENTSGETCEFVYNCGAARLNSTEWKNDFPIKE